MRVADNFDESTSNATCASVKRILRPATYSSHVFAVRDNERAIKDEGNA